MSYRDPKQSLEDPALKILEGIAEYRKALLERVSSGEWDAEAIHDWEQPLVKMSEIEVALAIVARDTW